MRKIKVNKIRAMAVCMAVRFIIPTERATMAVVAFFVLKALKFISS